MHDSFFDPLAAGENALSTRHAYSHVNSLSSAMQAYLTVGSEKHLHAAKNGFDMLMAQSFATGGWGPDERLRATDSPEVAASAPSPKLGTSTPQAFAIEIRTLVGLVVGNCKYRPILK